MKNEKGQLNSLSPAIIALLIGIITLVVGLIIIQEIRDTDTISKEYSAIQTMEAKTVRDGVYVSLNHASDPCVACTIINATNSTTGKLIGTSNYSLSNCRIISVNPNADNNTVWNLSYTYTTGEYACLGANSSLVGMGTFGDFIPIIVLAVIASIVIGLIFVGFGMHGRETR